MHGVEIAVEHKPGYPPTVNDVERARFALDVAADVCGEHAATAAGSVIKKVPVRDSVCAGASRNPVSGCAQRVARADGSRSAARSA